MRYKGRGEHSINKLEAMIEQLIEENIKLKSPNKYRSGQFWLETSMAINHDDQIIYVEAGTHDSIKSDGIKFRITDCSVRDKKVHHQMWLRPHEVDALIGVLTSVQGHIKNMNKLEMEEHLVNETYKEGVK